MALGNRAALYATDTAAAIVRGIAEALQDKGVSTSQAKPARDPWQSWSLRHSSALPAGVRRSLLTRLVVAQALPPARLGALDLQAVAGGTAQQYGAPDPDGPESPSGAGFPGLVIGSADGALAHLCALTGMPWLPQTHTLVVKWPDGDPDDAVSAADFGARVLPALRDANPDVTLHQSHDASQDRLVAGRVAYVRAKWVRLPEAYVRMIRHQLEPGAPIVILDDTARWPVTELAERLVLQAGGHGGLQAEDYLDGSSRVAEFLRRQGSTRSRFAAPEANRHAPDAEWGYDPQLTDAIVALAKETGHPVVRLSVTGPAQLAGPVADLARTRLRAAGGAGDRLLVESAALLDPMGAERAGLVPYWTFLPVQPGRHAVAGYLERAAGSSDRLSEAYVLMHPCGLETCGVARPDEWLGLARHAGGRIVLQPGIAERWPTHADTAGRLGRWLRSIPPDPGLPAGPLPLVPVEAALTAVATGEVTRDELA